MKNRVIQEIQDFVAEYQKDESISTAWDTPLVGFADAEDTLFQQLHTVISPTHAVPKDLLSDARSVIAFFLPFSRAVSSSNIKERISSPVWAMSYVETNEMISQLSRHLKKFFKAKDEKAVTIPATHNWIKEKLISNWSHRHVAYISGLGRFGLNNMLITSQGCCGRIGSLITSADIEPDKRPEIESCLYKYDGSCKKCSERCVNEALFEDSFDRFQCYEMLLENVEEHSSLGYADVCGKCLVAVPCSHTNPVMKKIQARPKK